MQSKYIKEVRWEEKNQGQLKQLDKKDEDEKR